MIFIFVYSCFLYEGADMKGAMSGAFAPESNKISDYRQCNCYQMHDSRQTNLEQHFYLLSASYPYL